MDLGIIVGLTLLVIWGIGTFAFEAPGWLHLLLTVGVFIVIWRIVVRGTPDPAKPGSTTATRKKH